MVGQWRGCGGVVDCSLLQPALRCLAAGDLRAISLASVRSPLRSPSPPLALRHQLQVGIGIKIALYDSTSDGTSYSAAAHRVQLGWALFMTFGHQLFLRPLHIGVSSYFTPLLSSPLSTI